MLYVLAPVFNRVKITLQFLELLEQQHDKEFKVVVIDDGSTDGTAEKIKEHYPHVHLVNGDGSWWWTRSVNEGIRYCLRFEDCNMILLMNDDTYFYPDYISSIKKAYKQVPGHVVGSISLTYEEPHRIFFSGVKKFKLLTNRGCLYHKPFELVDNVDLSGLKVSKALPGRGILIPTSIIRKYGLFDEKNLPQYGADFSYVTNLARKHGVDSYISWDSRLYTFTKLTGAGSSFTGESLSSFLKSFFKPMSRQYLPDQWQVCKVRFGPWLAIPALPLAMVRNLYGYFKRRNTLITDG